MPPLLTAAQVKEQYGYSRGELLSLEAAGRIHPTRTGGNQRRYDPSDLTALRAPLAAGTEPTGNEFRELGKTGVTRWSGSAYEENLRELRGKAGRKLYREMRVNDPVIAAAFFAIENTLKQADWRAKPASESDVDKAAASFLSECRDDLSSSWAETLTYVLEMLEQGFSVVEIVYKRRLGMEPPNYCTEPAASKFSDGRVGWRKWAPRPQESLVENNEFIMDKNGGVQGIRQQGDNLRDILEIPIEKLLLFRTTVVPAGNPFGVPIHRSMYTSYHYTRNLQEIEGIGVERDLAGIPIVYLGKDCTLRGTNSDYNIAVDLVTNLRNDEQAGIVVPHAKMGKGASDDQGMLVELLSSTGQRAHNVSEIISRYDKYKALTVLVQFIMLGLERQGSYALAKSQSDLFSIAAYAWLLNIADTINRHAVPKLFKYNVFPGMTGYPQLVPSTIGLPDLTAISAYINTLANQQLLTYSPELERHLRQIARLPTLEEGDLAQRENGGNGSSLMNQGLGQRAKVKDVSMLAVRLAALAQTMGEQGVEGAEEVQMMIAPIIDALAQEIKG